MAAKRAKAKTSSQTTTKVTRISASDSGAKKPALKKPALKKPSLRTKPEKSRQKPSSQTSTDPITAKRRSPFKATKDYFVGAWHELREVRWPTRRATWGMTGALLGFTAFFVVVILLLDTGFQYVFKLLIGQ